ncbi:Endopolyphosphatase [Yamadazyma tenuis]|uniref:Endopolyphosphatase n=1 Tax=Candida tenuis (strain ATCC 10573 / BCRC 21748 / CBS 615 / JCM 9827 / NBRC 10315 / NRRL Y-1498 / VKM Y-70) TaxID=590646 RepID=G3B057_CANTC|nr:uncharacterized protein CANTEDRAFT_103032 [Yamadazyma tenuis ATCC 10573]EGV65324.1 hypothetical protein CANTEDRAFT_103032 [Yamadazyma tenuis ATCC 10573]WEJ95021.1 Endopolyphosphatase [Yamadazyma tenuis]
MLKLIAPVLALYLWACSVTAPGLTASEVRLEAAAASDLQALNLTVRNPIAVNNQVIHGRFLHITDIHPDEFYRPGSSPDKMCHGGHGDAGRYGDAILGCDSPLELMNQTFEWINTHLKDKIDFIVWTGDNIRHDNDRNFPRTEMNIFDMNEHVSGSLYELFKNPDTSNPRNLVVDLIPSLGNNDVYPHNLFAPGPTLQTREMYKIWSHFIPQNQLHIFNRGAYFFREVVPGQLAVVSINTLYLFRSNPLVDNCDRRKDPGYKLFEWLGVVLKEMRARGMKVWLTGHVPPNEKNYDISCLRKYIIWSYEYRDVIIGGLYGHMNIDHFIPLDSRAAYRSLAGSGKVSVADWDGDESDDDDDDVDLVQQPPMRIAGGTPLNKVRYMDSVRSDVYGKIAKRRKSGPHGDRYTVAHVTASVIPTFNPGLRVWEYNTTGLASMLNNQPASANWDQFFAGVDRHMAYLDTVDDVDHTRGVSMFDYFSSRKDNTLPPKKPADIPVGPAYTPQTFTPLRYTQYYVDLASVNAGKKPFGYEHEYSTDDRTYHMESLLVENWLSLGRSLAAPVKNPVKAGDDPALAQLWDTFLAHSFVDSDYENLGYG